MVQKLKHTNKMGFTLIELMIVIAIIGILAAIAIPNFIAYRDKAYCGYAENDGANIKAAIACYFAEPENMSLGSIAQLQQGSGIDATCRISLNEGNIANIGLINIGTSTYWHIQVFDGSGRCPRGDCYNTYMGIDMQGSWGPCTAPIGPNGLPMPWWQ